jgi:hypothetical protein
MPISFHELSGRDRRRLITTSVVRTTLTTALLLVIYALAPAEPISTGEAFIRLAFALGMLVVVVAFQVHAIKSATTRT